MEAAVSIQAKLDPKDSRLYNINRDIAHNFANVARFVAARLDDQRWPVVHRILADNEVDLDELGKACSSFCLFVRSACDHPDETMQGALDRSGWNDVREEAQMAYMALLGTVIAGYYFAGVRDATMGGQGPCLTMDDLREAGKEARRLIVMPRWKKRLHRYLLKIKKIWHALRG
jgi:hypothetical protein